MRLPLLRTLPPGGLLRVGCQTQMMETAAGGLSWAELAAVEQPGLAADGPGLLERLGSLETTGWDGPGLLQSGGLDISYWDLHIFLLVPTVFLLTQGRPTLLTSEGDPLRRTAAFSYITFILSIAVAQAFVWDSVGANIGIWEFNPAKCTGLGTGTLLPLEEIAWLFHHVIKAALWQLKVCEWSFNAPSVPPAPMADELRQQGNMALFVLASFGVFALAGDIDAVKCLGLIATFFAPVLAIIWNLGSRYLRSHWKLFLVGWLAPGWWTVCIDCVGQQQGVWFFPPRYLTGLATLPDGLLKLDIAAVYLVSTLAVTATGAIVLAASEEFVALRSARREGSDGQLYMAPEYMASEYMTSEGSSDGQMVVGSSHAASVGATEAGLLRAGDPSLWDLGLFIFDNASPGAAASIERLRHQALERVGHQSQERVADSASSADSSSS